MFFTAANGSRACYGIGYRAYRAVRYRAFPLTAPTASSLALGRSQFALHTVMTVVLTKTAR